MQNKESTLEKVEGKLRVEELVLHARKALQYAYAPYSHFQVGAAAVTDTGKIYTGCNIENASYGATNCAERTAIFKAVSEGEKKLAAIAIVSKEDTFTPPCGICRQVMSEFMAPEAQVILSDASGQIKIYRLDEVLPMNFHL